MEQASEPVEAEEARVKVQVLEFIMDFREIGLKKFLPKVLNIGTNSHHLDVVVKGKDFLKKHGECPECLLVTFQDLDQPAQYEIHTLRITDYRIPFRVAKQNSPNSSNMAGVHMSYVLQLFINNGLPLDVKLDLMEAGVWVEREVLHQILIVICR